MRQPRGRPGLGLGQGWREADEVAQAHRVLHRQPGRRPPAPACWPAGCAGAAGLARRATHWPEGAVLESCIDTMDGPVQSHGPLPASGNLTTPMLRLQLLLPGLSPKPTASGKHAQAPHTGCSKFLGNGAENPGRAGLPCGLLQAQDGAHQPGQVTGPNPCLAGSLPSR